MIPGYVVEAFQREFWASAQIGEAEDRSIESGLQAALAAWGATIEEKGHRPAMVPFPPERNRRVVRAWTPVGVAAGASAQHPSPAPVRNITDSMGSES